MADKTKTYETHKPVNKATMDQPQEEFIEPESAHSNHDEGRDHEVEHSGDGRKTEARKHPA